MIAYNLKVCGCVQLSVFGFRNMVVAEEVRWLSIGQVHQLPLLGRHQMGTLLIVLLVLFLLGGGGWGYSRWRRN
ncbi:MAG: hypothetical protein WCE61_16680 [Candidatus Acidiferrum sp.]